MQELRLGWNKFGDAGAFNLASCIPNIEVLSIESGNIDEEGVAALAESIRGRDGEVIAALYVKF